MRASDILNTAPFGSLNEACTRVNCVGKKLAAASRPGGSNVDGVTKVFYPTVRFRGPADTETSDVEWGSSWSYSRFLPSTSLVLRNREADMRYLHKISVQIFKRSNICHPHGGQNRPEITGYEVYLGDCPATL